MNTLVNKLSQTATNMIRMDHTHVLATFHQYEIDASPKRKQALVNTVCLALEIHAQIEEEIFYPALRSLVTSSATLEKSMPEHTEMRRLITTLRAMKPKDSDYDETFMELMRDVLHHVADEETILLPAAERLMPARLGELGALMMKRRLQLAAPHAAEIASNLVGGLSATSVLVAAGAVLAGTYLATRSADHANGRAAHKQ